MAKARRRKNADGALIRSAEMIGWALGGLEREIAETRNRLSALTSEASKLRKQVGRSARQVLSAGAAAADTTSGRKRRMSAEGRQRIADAAKRRWAKWRAEKKGK